MNERLPVRAAGLPERFRRTALMLPPPPAPVGDQIRRSAAVLRRRWLPILLTFVVVFGAVAGYTWWREPQYTATATLLVNARMVNIATKESDVIPPANDEERAISAEAQILQSTDVATRVVDVLARRSPAWFTRLTGQRRLTESGRKDAIDALESRLRVDRPGATNVLAVGFDAPGPELAAFAANAFAEQYLASKADARVGAARSIDGGLRQELDALRGRLEEAEATVAQYRREHNLLSADGVTLTEREQSLYKQQEAAADTTLAEEQARLNTARAQLRRGSAGDDVGEALNSSVVNQLRAQHAQASAKLADLQSRYKPDFPKVIDARREVADIDSAIAAEIRRVVSNLEARVSVARERADAASGISGKSRAELAVNAGAAVGLNELERRAEAIRTNYAGLLQRQTAVASQTVVADSDARLLSPARPPLRPSVPNKKLNLALGALLAALLAAAVGALLQMLDQRFISSDEVERHLGLDHLVNIPEMMSIADWSDRAIAPIDYVLDRPFSLLTEAARNLLMMVGRPDAPGKGRIVGLTSAQPGEGKSALAAILARVAATSGRRTLVIDGDVRQPSLAAAFGVEAKFGFVDVVAGRVKLEDALIRDERSGAWLLPSLAQPLRHSEIGAEIAIAALLDKLRNVFDIIIVDTAPALAAVESRLLMHDVDVAVLIVRWKDTRAPTVRAALKRLRSTGVEPIGVAMTRVDMKAVAAYGFGDIDQGHRSWAGYGG